jgi:hypothetical protein
MPAAGWGPGGPVPIGSRLELFVDDHLIERLAGGAAQRLHQPTRRDVVMTTGERWEGNASHFRSVFRDGGRYRMYYGAMQYDIDGPKVTEPHPNFLCYAESRDGIHWTRPQLGLVEFEGSRSNNIVLGEGSAPGFRLNPTHAAVFKDDNPSCPAEARYKAVVLAVDPLRLCGFKSADGLHFSLASPRAIITRGALPPAPGERVLLHAGQPHPGFDSENLAFWDSHRGEYREYHRGFRDARRDILTATSKDFIEWTDPVWLSYPGSPPQQLYTNQIKPYYRAPHIFIGLPMRYVDPGVTDQIELLPSLRLRKDLMRDSPRYGTVMTDTLLMTSRDGLSFKRWDEAFIRPGIQRQGSWIYGDNSAAWGIVETRSDLPGAPGELSIYATEGYTVGRSLNVRRFTLRIDGFVSIQAPLAGGEIVTRPLVFQGHRLQINFSASAAGSIRVEIQDAAGAPIEGFSLADCPEMFGDELARVVRWKRGTDTAALAGKAVKLRFVLRDADLFSFRFRDRRDPAE